MYGLSSFVLRISTVLQSVASNAVFLTFVKEDTFITCHLLYILTKHPVMLRYGGEEGQTRYVRKVFNPPLCFA